MPIIDKTGITVQGYSHCLSAEDLRHSLNQHGIGAEKQNDQILLMEKDLEKIPAILVRTSWDSAEVRIFFAI